MRKLMSALLSLVLVIGLAAPMVHAEGDYGKTVKMLYQWTGESGRLDNDQTKTFTAGTDKLGGPIANGGLYRGLAKTFLGWSKKPLDENGFLQDRLYSMEDTVATVWPEGIPDDAELHGIYFELQDGPFVIGSSIFDNIKYLTLFSSSRFNMVNESAPGVPNTIILNENISDEDTTPDTPLVESNEADTGRAERKIVDVADLASDNSMNLDATFTMNPIISMLVYKNPWGGYTGPIFTRYTAERKVKPDGFKIENPDYTYVDLTVEMDERFDSGETYNLQFTSYSWRPLYVLDDQGAPMEIADPETGASLGSDSTSFNTLISNASPLTSFKVLNPNKSHKITVRVIVREGDAERIPEASVVPQEGRTVAEEITSKMKLISLSKPALQAKYPDLSAEDLVKNVVTVKKEAIEQFIADPDNTDPLLITGHIKGLAVADAGNISFFALRGTKEISRIDVATPIHLYYKQLKSTVTVKYQDEEGNELHPDVIDEADIPVDQDYDTTDQIKKTLYKDGVKYDVDLTLTIGQEKGKATKEPIVVTYIYKKSTVPDEHIFPEPLPKFPDPEKPTPGTKDQVPNTGAFRG